MSASDAVVALIAEIRSVAGADHTVGELLDAYADRVRAEPGNLTFAAWRTAEDPSRFLVYEEYADSTAFHEHVASAHSTEFNEQLSPHALGGRSTLTRLTAL